MSNRLAFFSDGTDLIEDFNLEKPGEAIFEPHYNIARGHHLPVISQDDKSFTVGRVRWGKKFEKDANPPSLLSAKEIKALAEKAEGRVIIPVSGFFIWKRDGEDDYPFFVRNIDNSLLFIAGHQFKDQDNDFSYVEALMMESNTLIQPITDQMPLILKKDHARDWLQGEVEEADVQKLAKKEFLITDLTVHRVSKELNDLSKNDASLIQPIPK